MKKAVVLVFVMWLLFSLANPLAAKAEETQAPSLVVSVDPPVVQVYGVKINAPAPFINDGVIWAPFRAVAEAYNMRVDWDADARTVIFIDNQGHTSFLTVDGINAVIIDGRTFVPYDFLVSQNFDDNNIMSRLGYSKEYVSAILDDRKIFRKYFTEPNEVWNLRGLTRGIPYPIGYRYQIADAQTEPIKSISISYDAYAYNDANYEPYPGGNGLNPFYDTISENNALVLFASIEDLEQVNFLYYINDELNRTASYTLADLTERFGAINPLDMGFEELYNAFTSNFQIPEWYFAHYSRLYLGAEPADVTYRNGEPDRITQQPDGSVIWTYTKLGESYSYRILPSGEQKIAVPGYTADYYFNNPFAKQNDDLSGLYATRFSVTDGEPYLELVAYLGFPAITKDMGGGYKYIAYPLRDGQKRHAYFILQNDIIITEGVMYGDDYTILDESI